MQAPQLIFGQGGGNRLFLYSPSACDDDGVLFSVLAATNRLAPGGSGGETIFTTLWLVVTAARTPAAAIAGSGTAHVFTGPAASWVADAMIGQYVTLWDGVVCLGRYRVTDNETNTLTFAEYVDGADSVNPHTVELIVTPYLDGVALESQEITITGPTAGDPTRVTTKYRFGLSVPFLDNSPIPQEVMRVAARGTWLQVRVETVGIKPPGDLIVEGCEVEYEVVRASQPAEVL